jgi:hypothetical protein
LVTVAAGVVEQDAAVDLQALEGDGLPDLGQVDVRLGDRDRRPDVVAARDQWSAYTCCTLAPQGSIETIFSASPHCGQGR